MAAACVARSHIIPIEYIIVTDMSVYGRFLGAKNYWTQPYICYVTTTTSMLPDWRSGFRLDAGEIKAHAG